MCVKKVITQTHTKLALFIKIVYIIPNKLIATRKVIQMLQKHQVQRLVSVLTRFNHTLQYIDRAAVTYSSLAPGISINYC